nr:hypothetical protein [Bacillus sp. FS02]
MSKSKIWIMTILTVLLIGGGGWIAYQAIAQKSGLNIPTPLHIRLMIV